MTPRQRDLARTALGLPNPSNRPTRNRYVESSYDNALTAMVTNGWAIRTPLSDGSTTPLCAYKLTRAGAELALEPGEMLDPEDFPVAQP